MSDTYLVFSKKGRDNLCHIFNGCLNPFRNSIFKMTFDANAFNRSGKYGDKKLVLEAHVGYVDSTNYKSTAVIKKAPGLINSVLNQYGFDTIINGQVHDRNKLEYLLYMTDYSGKLQGLTTEIYDELMYGVEEDIEETDSDEFVIESSDEDELDDSFIVSDSEDSTDSD